MTEQYDAGLLGDYDAADVQWWQCYIRTLLNEAHEFYEAEIERLQAKLDKQQPLVDAVNTWVAILDEYQDEQSTRTTSEIVADMTEAQCLLSNVARAVASAAKEENNARNL